jgi:spore germination cell wall hydrolase CwlJ-like protein
LWHDARACTNLRLVSHRLEFHQFMLRFTRRAGAFAAAAFIASFIVNTANGGAVAQDAVALPATESSDIAAPVQATDAAPATVRFVASPVVQEVPEQPEIVPETDAGSLGELVDTIPAGGEMSAELHCLAQAVYFESRGEPLAGQLAVARVVVNRAESARFPDDYCAVVTQRAQFSFVKGGHIPSPKTGSVAWQRARAIARIAHRELWESEAGDALYFHATHVRPRWAARMAQRASINRHVFYR